jgi:thiazole/oxazole-forming peptide maturase SagD family component
MPVMRQDQTDTVNSLTCALALDFQLHALEDMDRPVFLAVAWPVKEGITGLKPRLPAGRGLTPAQALIAAGAEALELRASLSQRHLTRLAALPRRDGLATALARDLLTGHQVPIPAQEVWLDCAATLEEPLVCDATSTGCAAGRTRQEATQAALCECIERDALALWWHGGHAPRPLALEVIDRLQPRLFWWLRRRGRNTRLLDLTSDIGLPVVAAVSSDRYGQLVAVGSAARPDVADAALAAVTEMVQAEAAMEAARAARDPELLTWDAHASISRQAQFNPVEGTPPPPPADLLQRLAEHGLTALAIDLTLPEDPLPTMRVIVPGLCAMRGRFDTARFRRLCAPGQQPDFPEPY